MTRLAMATLAAALLTATPVAAVSWTVSFPLLTFGSDSVSPPVTPPATPAPAPQTGR